MYIHTKPKILKQRKHSGKGILSIRGNKFRIVRLEQQISYIFILVD